MRWLVFVSSLFVASSAAAFDRPATPFEPRSYLCRRAPEPVVIDGRLDDDVWSDAAWTDLFVDIEGRLKPPPRFATRVKMLWDDTYFYVAAEMEEPHLWGTLTERDDVLYLDYDFELFVDPDGDTHDYYELEINALGTEWDLFITKPYRDADASALHAWDIPGLRTAVHLDGTLNDPSDVDRGWTVELAVPWKPLQEGTRVPSPPRVGDQWRVNFSRVEWQLRVEGDGYVKETDPKTGRSLPENNWVWSPQGLIAMHYPERWGIVQFAPDATTDATFRKPEDLGVQGALFDLFYAQRSYEETNGRFAESLDELDLADFPYPVRLDAGPGYFHATTDVPGVGRHQIDDEGRFVRLATP